MSKNASDAEKDEVSKQGEASQATEHSSVTPGTIVRSPEGREWVVIDPKRLDGDLPTKSFYWLGAVSADCESDSRGCGKETFRQEGWEVL